VRRIPVIVAVAVLVLAVLAGGIWLGGHPDRLPSGVRSALVGDQQAQLFAEAQRRIEDDYYRAVAPDALTNDAISGMVDDLHDRYSRYIPPQQYGRYLQSTNAQFTGVGIEVSKAPRGLHVARVYPGSPARRAGLRAGDTIVEAAGHPLAGLSTNAASRFIRGRQGTKVALVVERDGRRITRRVTRDVVSVPVVASKMLRTPDGRKVAQVALATFSSGAHGELRREIDRRRKQGAQGILLDLRHNGGGLLDEARLVASIFIPDGRIVTIRGRHQPTRTLTAAGDAIPAKIPVDVLVDDQTASSAEIVAGAIQDRGRGKVVGTHTYGKGVFQEVTRLSNGGALDLTVGEYFLPSGRNLGGGGVKRGRGIQPNVKAPDNPRTATDETVDAGLKLLDGQLHG
jgi:carboxyl-terminal processing protease